jgi:hypothetical protein
VLTVSVDPVVVESQLSGGALACPCGGVLARWGHARVRMVLGGDRVWRVRPRRGRCRTCAVTHVLLPSVLLLRRAHVVGVIGRVLELAAVGVSQRRIVALTGVARSTVRGWLARLAVRAEMLREHFIAWLVWLAPSSARLEVTGWGARADAVAAIAAVGARARTTLGIDDVWALASAATGGRLLANTSAPFPAPWEG